GNALLTLTADVTSTGNSALTSNLSLGTATRTFNVTSGSLSTRLATTSVSGAPGVGLIKNGARALNLRGEHTYTGPTTVNGGVLFLGGASIFPASIASDVTANAGTTIRGFGPFDAITGNGVTLDPGEAAAQFASVTGVLQVTGNLALSGNSKLHVDIGG